MNFKIISKIVNLFILAIITVNFLSTPAYAIFCKDQMAIPTIESLGAEALKEGSYEEGWVETTCPKIQKGSNQGPVSENTPYIIGPCSEPVRADECQATPYDEAHDPKDSDSVITCQRVYFVCGDTGAAILKNYIRTIYIWGASMCAIIAVLIIVVSGIQISASGGDSSKVDEAKNRIFQSLSGLVLLFLSGLILYTINPTFFIK